MYRIHQIKLKLGEKTHILPEKILKKMGPAAKGLAINKWKIVKESIDARDKDNIRLVYSVDFDVVSARNPEKHVSLRTGSGTGLEDAPDMSYIPVSSDPQAAPMKDRPVIVGFGHARMFEEIIIKRKE